MSERLTDPYIFSWSSKHTRLSFQMFVSALLAAVASKFEIKSLNFFGMITFEDAPEKEIAYVVLFGFAVFSFLAFVVRTLYELPKLFEQAKTFGQSLKRSQVELKKTSLMFKKISKEPKFLFFFEGDHAEFFTAEQQANIDLKKMVEDLSNACRKLALHCMESPNAIPESFSKMPDKLKTFGAARYSVVSGPLNSLERKVSITDKGGGYMNLSDSMRNLDGYNVKITDLSQSDVTLLSNTAKKASFALLVLRVRLKLSLFYRFLDIYLLSIIVPVVVSGLLLFIPLKQLFTPI